MGMLLRRTSLRWAASRYWDILSTRRFLAAVLAIAAPLALLFLMGNRRVQPAPDPHIPLDAEIARLEQKISEGASDVAALRLMADQARAELATLNQQKETE